MNLFPPSWKLEKANTICSEIVDCINKTAPTVDYDTPYKMIRTTNVKGGRIILDDARCVDEATFIKWNRRLKPRKNDVVLTREAPLGDVGLIRTDDKLMLGQRTMIYRANEKQLNQNFLYYSLLGPTLQAQLKTLGSGSTVEHVRVPDAENLIIPYPPIGVQKKIAAILSAYDDLIENNKRRITLLGKMAEEIYREWFVRFRFPGYQTAEFEKGIPKGWIPVKFDSICKFEKGKNPELVEEFLAEDLSIYINMDTLAGGMNSFAKKEKNSVIANIGDLLMLMDGSRSGLVFRASNNGIVGSTFSVIRTSEHMKNFVYEYLKATSEAIISDNTGSAIPHANKEFIKRMIMFVPKDTAVINKFNMLYNAKYSLLENIKNQNDLLEITKNKLLPRLISGKLSVENLNIQFLPSMQEESTV
jgi:type I restriction enzyme, S subunit